MNDNKGHYLVRAMSQSQEDFDVFFNNNVVAVGWRDVNFTQFDDPDSLANKVRDTYYKNGESAPQVIGKKINEVRRFKGIKTGDRIVVPSWGAICLAEVEADELYSKQDYQRDLSNQKKVNYHRTQSRDIVLIPRDKLSEGLQRRLRVRGTTIADLWEFSEEIDHLFESEDFDSIYNKKRIEAIDNFKENLLRNIQSGNTNLKPGGVGMEELIQELLVIDGYKAKIPSKRRFPGFADADIEATKECFHKQDKLLVQVKHHSGVTGTWGVEQLTKIIKTEKSLFSEHRLVLVTSAKPSPELVELCKNKDVTLVSGNDLSEWVFISLKEMKPETKKRLKICDVPTLLI